MTPVQNATNETVAFLEGWCRASGSEDEFRIVDGMDTVQCQECKRWLYLTRLGTLPRHKETASSYGPLD